MVEKFLGPETRKRKRKGKKEKGKRKGKKGRKKGQVSKDFISWVNTRPENPERSQKRTKGARGEGEKVRKK